MSTTPFGYPSYLYHCLLDEQPHYLVPTRLLHEYEESDDLIVNPRCWFSWHGPLPPDKAVRVAFAEHFCPSDWTVWVDDSATGINWPFWVGHEYMQYLSQMTPGYPPAAGLPEHAIWVLREANILVKGNFDLHRRNMFVRALRNNAIQFEQGYTSLTGFIHPFHVGALRRYYRCHSRIGSFAFGDSQVDRRYAAYNENVSRFYQYQLTQLISEVTESVVAPTYSYFAGYQSGSNLDWHTDRDECEYSLSLCVDASPEPTEQNPWPLDLMTHHGMLRSWQYIGDALLYRGTHLPHAREQLYQGHTSSSMLLHYVDDVALPYSRSLQSGHELVQDSEIYA
jgi:hypothetical protein